MKRSFLLPTASLITMATTSGCIPEAVVGLWELTQITYDGTVYVLPLYYDDWVELEVDADGDADFRSGFYGYIYNYAGTWTKRFKKNYRLTFPEENLVFDCSILSQQGMDCSTATGSIFAFDRLY